MADTIVDDPTHTDDDAPDDDAEPIERPPPTLPDGPPPNKPYKKSVAAIIGILLTAIVGLGVGLVYVLLVRYVPTARRHIPGNANVAIRLEAADIVLFAPVRKHIFTFFDGPTGATPTPTTPPKPSRAARIKQETGVDVHTDIRELIVASVDTTGWVFVMGGKIARGRFVSGVNKVLTEDGFTTSMDGDLLHIQHGGVLAQAEDGTIVFGTDASIVNAALPATDEWVRLALPETGAVTFAVTGAAFGGIAGMTSPIPHVNVLAHIDRATGTLTLGSHPTISARFEPISASSPAALTGELETIVSDLKIVTALFPDRYDMKDGLEATTVTAGPDAALVHIEWPYAGVEQAVDDVARLLGK